MVVRDRNLSLRDPDRYAEPPSRYEEGLYRPSASFSEKWYCTILHSPSWITRVSE